MGGKKNPKPEDVDQSSLGTEAAKALAARTEQARIEALRKQIEERKGK